MAKFTYRANGNADTLTFTGPLVGLMPELVELLGRKLKADEATLAGILVVMAANRKPLEVNGARYLLNNVPDRELATAHEYVLRVVSATPAALAPLDGHL